MSKTRGISPSKRNRFVCGALSILMAMGALPGYALGDEVVPGDTAAEKSAVEAVATAAPAETQAAEPTAAASDAADAAETAVSAAVDTASPEPTAEVIDQNIVHADMKLENGYYYQLIAPGTRTTVTFTNSGDSLPYGAVLTLTGDGIEVAPSSVTVNGSKSYSFVISAASEGVHKAKLVAKTAAGYEYYSRELLFICARDRYDFDIPVICSDMVGESIQKVDFLQADNPSTKLAINPDLMPSGYRAAWNISHTTGDGSATIKLTDSSTQRTPPVLYTKSGVGKAEATITLTVILPAGEVLEREIPVEYEVRAQVPMSFKTTGDVVVAKLGETAAVDLTTGEAGSALTDGMSVSAAFKSNYDATLTTTTFSADKGFSIGATRSGVYQVTVTAVSDVPGLADGAKFSKDVCLIVADENGNLPFGLFKITPDKLSATLYSDASTLGTVSVIPTFDIPDGTAFLTEWSVKDSKGNTANITADTTGHARGDVAMLKTAGSVTAGEYTVTATINLAGAVTTVSVPLTLTAGQPVIDGLRESYTVPYSYSEYVISAPGVMLEKSSGKWAEYNGSVKWKCEAADSSAKSALASIKTDSSSGYTRITLASPRKNGCYNVKFTATLADGRSASATVTLELADANGVVPTPAPTADPSKPRMGTVTAKRVNVRSGAGTTFSALGQVEQGTRISVTGWNNEWYKFTFNGKDAYIKGEYVKLDALPTTAPTAAPAATTTPKPTATPAPAESGDMGRVNVSSGALRLRESADGSARVLTTMPAGASVQILGEEGDWYKVRYGSYTGFCSKQYITRTSSPTAKPTATAKPGATATPAPTASAQVGTVTLSNTSSKLIVRAAASRTSAEVTRVGHGTQVTILGSESGFYKIKVGTYTGYVVKDYVKLAQSPSAKPTATPKPTATASPSVKYCTVIKSGGLALHETEQGATVRTIPNYGVVQLIKDFGTWAHVKYEGTTGYVESKYLKSGIIKPDDSNYLKAKVTLSTSSTMFLRASASKSANVVTTIPNGATVDVIERGTTWHKVRYNGSTGYCMGKYLTILG